MSTNENGWAKELSEQTLLDFMAIGDGHTLFKPQAYIDIGIPEEMVKLYTVTHHSTKTATYAAITSLSEAIEKVLNEYVHNDGWDPRELLSELRDVDDCRMSEQMATDVLGEMISDGVETISGYHPKSTIFDNEGNVIESMDAVYGLDITAGVVASLGLKAEGKIGRGFQYMSYCKAIQEYLDNK